MPAAVFSSKLFQAKSPSASAIHSSYGDRVLQRRVRHMRGVGEHDVALDRRQPVGELFQQRHEGEIGHHHAILGVIDDPCDLVGEQARVDGVIDRADPHDAVPGFDMAEGVPGERRDPVAEAYAVALQPLRDFQRAVCAPRA